MDPLWGGHWHLDSDGLGQRGAQAGGGKEEHSEAGHSPCSLGWSARAGCPPHLMTQELSSWKGSRPTPVLCPSGLGAIAAL